jgi:hypothetical protein
MRNARLVSVVLLALVGHAGAAPMPAASSPATVSVPKPAKNASATAPSPAPAPISVSINDTSQYHAPFDNDKPIWADSGWWAAFGTILLAALSFVQALFFWRQLEMMRGAVKDTQRQLDQAKRGFDAQYRPIVSFEVHSTEGLNWDRRGMVISFDVLTKNVGGAIADIGFEFWLFSFQSDDVEQRAKAYFTTDAVPKNNRRTLIPTESDSIFIELSRTRAEIRADLNLMRNTTNEYVRPVLLVGITYRGALVDQIFHTVKAFEMAALDYNGEDVIERNIDFEESISNDRLVFGPNLFVHPRAD